LHILWRFRSASALSSQFSLSSSSVSFKPETAKTIWAY